ncbi:MAG: MFS transporter [Patescibacteria group bacterium]
MPFRFYFDNSRNLRILYLIRINKDLVKKLSYFFFPVFLFNIGKDFDLFRQFNLSDLQRGMLFIPIYYLVTRILILFTSIPISKLISILGQRKSLIIAHTLQIITTFCFWMMIHNPYFVFLAAVVNSFQAPFFWSSYHTILSSHAMKSHMGQDLGLLQFLLQIIQAVSPAIAGLIFFQLGYEPLFVIAIILNLIGMFVSLYLEPKSIKHGPSWQEFFSWMKEKQYRLLSVSMMGRHIHEVMLLLWPLYVLFILGSVDKVGYLYTLSLFLAMTFSFFIGIYIDHHKSRKPFVTSGGLLSIIWLLRSQVTTAMGVAVADLIDRLTANFHWLFFDSLLFKRSKGKKSLSYFTYREMIISVSEVFIWSTFITVFSISDNWTVLFIAASTGVLMSLLMKERSLN